MNLERYLIIVLLVISIFLGLDKLDTYYTEKAYAKVSITKDETVIINLLSRRIQSEEIYANNVYALGYDLLKIHEKILNLLISKHVITSTEAKSILMETKKQTDTGRRRQNEK